MVSKRKMLTSRRGIGDASRQRCKRCSRDEKREASEIAKRTGIAFLLTKMQPVVEYVMMANETPL